MKVLAIVAALFGCVLALPAKLDHLEPRGYNYEPPAEPAGLYEVPSSTTTTTTPPPPPPVSGYLPPEPDLDASDHVVVPLEPEPDKSQMMLMPYSFSYGVDAEEEDGPKFRHEEVSDGANVEGEYHVLLPDGRTQIVRFKSSPDTGYVAEVTYE